MKIVLAFACFCLLALGVAIAGDPEPADTATTQMQPIEALPLSGDERAFEFIDGEADVNDNLIRRFAVGGREVTASYRNKGEKRLHPRYVAKLYNPYGLLLGEAKGGQWGDFPVDPGEVATEDLFIEWYPLKPIFAKSKLELPDDWEDVKWVVVTDSNTNAQK